MLQNQPAASVRLSASAQGKVAGGRSSAMVRLVNGSRYARLVRLATEWKASEAEAPYLVMYSDNYFSTPFARREPRNLTRPAAAAGQQQAAPGSHRGRRQQRRGRDYSDPTLAAVGSLRSATKRYTGCFLHQMLLCCQRHSPGSDTDRSAQFGEQEDEILRRPKNDCR